MFTIDLGWAMSEIFIIHWITILIDIAHHTFNPFFPYLPIASDKYSRINSSH